MAKCPVLGVSGIAATRLCPSGLAGGVVEAWERDAVRFGGSPHRAASALRAARRRARQGRGAAMLAQDIDFHQIFKVHPTAMALVTADFVLIDANDEFLLAAGHSLDEMAGHNVFEMLPKMHDDSGVPRWTALEEAVTTGHREAYDLTRYDIEDPARPGVFEERYWSTVVVPIRGASGQVEVLEFSAREVTPIIMQFRAMQAGEERDADPRTRRSRQP